MGQYPASQPDRQDSTSPAKGQANHQSEQTRLEVFEYLPPDIMALLFALGQWVPESELAWAGQSLVKAMWDGVLRGWIECRRAIPEEWWFVENGVKGPTQRTEGGFQFRTTKVGEEMLRKFEEVRQEEVKRLMCEELLKRTARIHFEAAVAASGMAAETPCPKQPTRQATPQHADGSFTAAEQCQPGAFFGGAAPTQDKLKSLSAACWKAWRSYEYVEKKLEQEVTDDKAYDWLKEHGIDDPTAGDLQDYELPDRETWKRYLREARRRFGRGKHSCRHGRLTGRSVVRSGGL